MEGAKTIAHELADQLPNATAVYVPVGGGGLLSAIWRGYQEVGATLSTLPRIVAVQPEGCPTVREALRGAPPTLTGRARTRISGLQVATLFDSVDVVDAVRQSGGHLVEVSDSDIRDMQRRLATDEGLLLEPAGATAAAGLRADVESGRLGRGDRVVVVATGAGFKDSAALQRLRVGVVEPTVTVDEIAAVLEAAQTSSTSSG
jgi:threonine synthase